MTNRFLYRFPKINQLEPGVAIVADFDMVRADGFFWIEFIMIEDQADLDRLLVQLAQQGERNAFGLLVTKYRGRIMRLASHIIPNHADAEDAVQETFIKAFRALPSFRGDASFYTWLYRIAINVARTHWQRNNKHGLTHISTGFDDDFFDGDPYCPVEADNPESILAGKQVAIDIISAIEILPYELRAALILREIEGLSYQQIGNILECPLGTVRSRIFRAREIMADRLARC